MCFCAAFYSVAFFCPCASLAAFLMSKAFSPRVCFLLVALWGLFFRFRLQITEMEAILSTRNDETKELKVKRKPVFFGRVNASFGLVIGLVLVLV